MRRWNGWGDETLDYPMTEVTRMFLERVIGPSQPPQDATFAEVVHTVPPSRLPAHPLVSDAPDVRLRHARGQSLPDWLALRSGDVGCFPDGVAAPTQPAEVQALLRYAHEVGARIIPYGGGTSVAGHITPVPGATPVLTIALGHLNHLERLDERAQLATFGAGVSGPDLEATLRARGYTLGHFPQSFEYSTLGGWIVTRSSGQQSLGYGRIEGLFAGGIVESPVGTLALPPFPASAAGPDLRQVVLGSEGRIGIVTQATVRVVPVPQAERFYGVFFPTWEAGLRAVREIVQTRLPLSMMRLSTPQETATTLAMAGHATLLGPAERALALCGMGEGKCLAIFGLTGSRRAVAWGWQETAALARQHRGLPTGTFFGNQWRKNRFRSPYLRNALWQAGYAVDTVETATTWERVPDTLRVVEAALRAALAPWEERILVFTHLSHLYPTGSSLYTTFVYRLAPDVEQNRQRWGALKRAASEAMVACGATISHQHGVGSDHAPYLAAEKGPLGMQVLADLCHRFDPDGLMNPGKLLGES